MKYKQNYAKELPYIILVSLALIYGFSLLKLLDTPKLVEWPPKVDVVKAQEASPILTPKTYDVTQWGDVAEGYDEVVDEINKVWGDDNYIGLRIAHCESRFGRYRIHTNTDGSHDISVFQINDKWHIKRGDILNWKENIKIAKEIFDEQGGNPWVCYQLYGKGW